MKKSRFASLLFVAAGVSGMAFAVIMTGHSFRIPSVFVGGAGGKSVSSSYKNTSTAGITPSGGTLSSASYRLKSGLLSQKMPGKTTSVTQLNIDETSLITLSPPSGVVTVEIPAGSFQETVVLTAKIPRTFPDLASNIATFSGTSLGLELTTDKPLQPQKPVVITFHYRDGDIRGTNENRLRVAYYIDLEKRWVPLPSTVDAANNTITTSVRHFTLFRVVDWVPASTLGGVFVYPNPLRPSLGHTQLNLTNMPAYVPVSIYTLSGELVIELQADATGRAAWDGKNGAGDPAASSVYLALVRYGSETKTVKIAVER